MSHYSDQDMVTAFLIGSGMILGLRKLAAPTDEENRTIAEAVVSFLDEARRTRRPISEVVQAQVQAALAAPEPRRLPDDGPPREDDDVEEHRFRS